MHPNKHIRAAIQYALDHGWTSRPGHHAFCILHCPAGTRGACIISVWSTPGDPEAHARRIQRKVDNCQHGGRG
jgi:hypothetical protein